VVPILQKLEEDGAIDNSVCSQAALPGGNPTPLDPYTTDFRFPVDFNERYSASHHGRRRVKYRGDVSRVRYLKCFPDPSTLYFRP
jgi:hypothetical protein